VPPGRGQARPPPWPTPSEATAAAESQAKALEELRAKAGLARAAADGHREEAERHEARAAEADRLGPEIEAATARVASWPPRPRP
jgi:hypothetical protein